MGPDEVASFLTDYLTKHVRKQLTSYIFSRITVPGKIRVCLALTDTCKFKVIKQYFPLRGHSYNPCDRKFSVIKRPIKKCDRMYTPREICELIANAGKTSRVSHASRDRHDHRAFYLVACFL